MGSWEILTAEMKRYEYAISAAGHISYNAPSGYHDDCVIALALANQGRWEMGNAGSMARIVGGGGKWQGVRGARAETLRRRGERVLVG